MIIDVVFSGWRNYDTTLRKVGAYEIWAANDSIAHLAEHGPGAIGGRQNEAAAAQSVAAGLIRFADEFGIGDDEVLVDAWQQSTAGYEFGHLQDTFVGGVKGIGPALFAYLRMRSGADTIKPDTQVASALRDFGFKVNTSDPHAVLAVALRVAADLKMRPLVLDQLLWDKDWRIDLN